MASNKEKWVIFSAEYNKIKHRFSEEPLRLELLQVPLVVRTGTPFACKVLLSLPPNVLQSNFHLLDLMGCGVFLH